MLTCENAARFATEAIAEIGDAPPDGLYEGRGIVTCGGGIKYGTCAWVLIRLLRHLGCTLPIEVWSLNDDEFDPQWVKLVEPFGVSCVNANEVLKRHPHRRLRGWELKPYSILHSQFREVLFLDADNVPVFDPTFLFDTPQFRETGTVFWPDPKHHNSPSDSVCWEVFGLPFREGPDQESGQLLIDKSQCWKALRLCNWYNEHSDFYYQYIYGDKDTFRFAWQRLEKPISWIASYPGENVLFTLCQHDSEGRVLFQHRFYRKWSLYGDNTPIPGFEHEELCLGFVEELRRRWQPQKHLMRHASARDHSVMTRLAGRRFLYHRLGHNQWPIRLGESGRITEGFGPNEFFWWCEDGSLIFAGADGKRKCRFSSVGNDAWEGSRLDQARIQLRISPLESEAAA